MAVVGCGESNGVGTASVGVLASAIGTCGVVSTYGAPKSCTIKVVSTPARSPSITATPIS